MRLKSLKSKLLVAVSALVIGTGLLTSLLVTQRYSRSLLETMTAQAENLAHAVSLQSADKILIHDLVALQKMLDHEMRSHSSIAYLFIVKDGQVLAHTFSTGIPGELIKANEAPAEDQAHFKKIASTRGEHYLDIAWPIFGGKGGVLRLGFTEGPYRQRMTRLWLQMSVLTMGILLLALAGSLIFVRRITGPLAELARATKKIDKGELNVRVQVQGEDEVGTLAYSFNHMVSRVEEYTRRLEEQTMDLERAHHQTRTFCEVVHAIGALSSLDEIGSYLIKRIQNILKCVDMVLLVFSRNKDSFFALSAKGSNVQKDPWAIQTAEAALENLEKVTSTKRAIFKPPLVPDDFQAETPQVIVPLHYENELLGALIVACPEDCRCNLKELDVVSLILTQAAGVIRRALLQEEELNDLQGRIEITPEFCGIIGKDPKMQMIYKLIENIAHTDATALIQGESGTGKELVAQAIHQLSPRKAKPFIVINCSAYPATLLESELFGHEKGAFTGAIRQKSGRFEQAHGGTVFLDEIGEVPLSAQIKLLRVLQSRTFERLGGEQTLAVDIRILAATHKDLLQEVKNDHFREDLFYRLNVIPINLPPLRERRNDIPLLARHFLSRFSARKDEEIMEFSPGAMRLLLDYFWPGNVRELENSIEHAAVLAKGGEIVPTDLPAVLHSGTASPAQAGSLSSILAEHERKFLHVEMVEQEKKLLQKVLEESRWNKKLASQRLGISRSTLYEKLRKYQIIRPTTH